MAKDLFEEENDERRRIEKQKADSIDQGIAKSHSRIDGLTTEFNIFNTNIEIVVKEVKNSIAVLIDKTNIDCTAIDNRINLVENRLDESLKNIQSALSIKELIHIKDMHDLFYTNPTLQEDTKKQVFTRYVDIYKKNHIDDLNYKFDHDGNPETDQITLMDYLNGYI